MSGPAFGSIDGLLAQAGWLNRLARQLVRDGDVAEDVAQEVWMAAGRAPPEPGRPPRPWLKQVLRNVVRMRARSEGRRRRWEAAAAETASVSSPEAVYEQLELHRAVVECVMMLEEPLRATLLFRYFEERSSFEIARLMDVPAGTVRRRLKTALEDLRRELDRRFGTRRSWALALAPAARLAMTAAMGKGALLMAIKLKVSVAVAAVVVALLAGGTAWVLHGRGGDSPGAKEAARARGVARDWPPEVAERAAASVAGVVRDADGNAVGGATVLLAREPGPTELGGSVRRPAGLAVADGAGRFHVADLREGRYVATASAASRGPGRSLPFALANGETAQITVVLGAAGHPVEGRVLDADGQSPIIGARVLATPTASLAATGPQPLFQATTDERGAYRLTLGTGEFRLRAEASGYAPREEPVAATRAVVRDFRLRPAARISGQVLERDTRRPVAGAEVRLTPLSIRPREGYRQTRSDDSGNFSFDDGDPGTYRVLARRGRLAGGGPAIHVVEAQAVTGMDIAVDAMASVAGSAVDEKGRGVADAKILLWSPDSSPTAGLATASRADGAFRIEGVAPGTYLVRAESASSAMLFNSDPITVMRDDLDGIKVVLQRGATLTGTVLSAGGTPVADADVRVDAPPSSKQFVRGRTSNVDGSFRIPGLSAGKLVIRVRHAELGLGREEVTVAEGQEVAVKVKLADPGASVTGVVKRANGAVVGGASVSVTAQGSQSAYGSATAEPDGRFTIGALAEGRYTVWARPRGGPMNISTSQARPDLQIVTLAAGERHTVDLTVGNGDKSVAGRVVLADGKPAVGAVVVANREEGDRSWKPDTFMLTTSATAGPDGRFVLDGLDDDVVRVWASRPGFPDTEVKQVSTGRSDLVIALRAPAGVAGTVVTKAGSPAAVFTVTIAGAPAAGENINQRYRRTEQGALAPLPVHDPTGAFAIDGLEAGDYELKLTSPEGGVASQRITLGAGERKTGVRIVLEAGARIIGRVVELEGGAPIAGATIQGRAAGRSFNTNTRADGTFELANLAPTEQMRLDIRVMNAERLNPEYREVTIPAGGATVDVGLVKLLKTDEPWPERSRDGVGLGLLAKAAGEGVVAGDLRPGSPAEKAGVKAGDLLLAIDGRDLTKLGPGAAMYFFYGPPGSSAALKVQTPGSDPRTVTIVRNVPPKPPAK